MTGTANAQQINNALLTLKRLKIRRLFILALRLAVPAFGVLLLLFLLWPVILDLLLPTNSFDSIRIEQNRLIVDAPRAQGNMADGGTYEFTAQTASSEIDKPDYVYLDFLLGIFNFADGTEFRATSDTGEYSFSTEILTLTSQIDFLSSNGDEGTIGSGVADIQKQQFSGKDGVKFQFEDGMELEADTMFYNAPQRVWTFTDATLIMDEN